ncbi:putative thiamine transport system permease protein [Rubricella aquisinus]|uniref:Putative thiamine transport system permease protein n=1 Tax=Rubricella aquisinus TaxID=2028108 RepID=A0A840X3G6_9RHOB|nr:ABC transporter permease subunit [Rubricella aquisinus]MBB5515217.1 putative thiamine transport system permease protein [Rubricella aquisinus]
MNRGRPLRFAPLLTILLLIGPVGAGVLGTLAPAFGYLPALGGVSVTLDPWRDLMAWQGLWPAAWLSISTGIGATVISLIISTLIVAAWQGTRVFAFVMRALSPLLSVPHAAAAFGLAFLIAPSGWISRALSPHITGWERPPDILITQDPMGLSMMAALVVKEVPFLLLMTMAALGQTDSLRMRMSAQVLGYGRVWGWLLAVFPRVYPQIRLPIYAVLAYSMSVVDVALILGPTRPPTLSVQVLTWMSDPDLSLRFQAAAGAVLQLGLVLAALFAWRSAERVVARLGCGIAMRGHRGAGGDAASRGVALSLAMICAGAVLFGLGALTVWSFAGLWQFPDLLPQQLSLRVWMAQSGNLAAATKDTVIIGVAATGIALLLVIACLEAEYRHGLRTSGRALLLLYIPLIVPQVAFLPGLSIFAILTGVDGGIAAVIMAHAVFVLPYVFLSLADPWRAWDQRLGLAAQTLGAGAERVLWGVRLPMLLRPVLTAAAVGFAVSVGQYLPTLLIGAGRIETLTTEAVALASGGNRRLIGMYALLQMVTPLAAFTVAILVPSLIYRNRRGLSVSV